MKKKGAFDKFWEEGNENVKIIGGKFWSHVRVLRSYFGAFSFNKI
jgi:hypothetical protein